MNSPTVSRRLAAVKHLPLIAVLVMLLVAAPPANATPEHFGLRAFDMTFVDEEGFSQALAGTHPYEVTTSFAASLEEVEGGKELPGGFTKDFIVRLIPGFIGDQTAVPKCSTLDFLTATIENATGCPNSTAIGKVRLEVSEVNGIYTEISPLFNLEPTPGSAARLGFFASEVPVTISVATAEDPPYNLLAASRNISQVLEFYAGELTIWGTPADPRHDEERGACYKGGKACPAGLPQQPFLTLPRSCSGPLSTHYEIDSWENPGEWKNGFALTHDDAVPPNPQGMNGCGGLGFSPSTNAAFSTSRAESSSGLDFSIDVIDEGLKESDGRAMADIEALRLSLPTGVTANPSAAEGLGVCSLARYEAERLYGEPGEGCPAASKLGSVEAQTPILEDHPLRGSLYLASQDDNPFGSLLALYMVFRDPELGILIKLAGKVEPDPATGRLVTTFEGLPPYPLSHVSARMRSGPRAPLITPSICGTYATEALLFPSSGATPLKSTSTFKIDSGADGGPCPSGPPPFHPGFEAGSMNNAAGAYSPFVMRLTRQDGDQDITRFSATLPKGVVPRFAGLTKCSNAAIETAKSRIGREELASPSCPDLSKVGRILSGAGVGTALTYVPGSLYLAGPYHGAPLSVVAIVPAVAGPFDVGTIVTRVALDINPLTWEGEVDGAASDPIPHILKGLPLKVRDIRVFADRSNFTLVPTSCAEKQTRAQVFGGGIDPFSVVDDAPVSVASRYQAASCASLNFKPKLALKLKGGTRRSDHPALTATLTYPKGAGYANIRDAITILPPTLFIDNAHVNNPCTRVQFNAHTCPSSSVLGSAKATTPLLDEPLEGPIYFRSNGGERNLPDIVADLNGQFHIPLVGFVDSRNARIRTRFLAVPDAPVERFELKLFGGRKGLLVNSANLCRRKQEARVSLIAQSGRRQDARSVLGTACRDTARSPRVSAVP